jgi:uncharacterized glyoxalase superfamily protein PhnB
MENRSAPPGAIVPSLIYNDVGKAVEWLCAAFGFQERLRAPATGRIGHAQLLVGDGGIILGEGRVGQGSNRGDSAEFHPPQRGVVSMTLTVRVEDVDQHFEQARSFGARILHPPTDYPYGERQYTAGDLDGYRWNFTQSIADVSPETWGAKAAIAE